MDKLKNLLTDYKREEDKHISREFQQYGYDLAVELGDMDHKALYIKMAKTEPREILDKARSFVADANCRSKGRLFMWKVSELKKQLKELKQILKK
jgi:hypothetical protein